MKMQAAIHGGGTGTAHVHLSQTNMPTPREGEVTLKLAYAGLNRHDIFVLNARDEQSSPLVVGSDGIGTVSAVGPGLTRDDFAGEWIINPCLGWDDPEAVPVVPEILGDPKWGTLAEYVTVPAENIARPPGHLSRVESSVLGLAGMTVYRALFTVGALQAGEHLLLPGAGGGVATLAQEFAKAIGANVTVTSRRDEVRQAALSRGADAAIPTDTEWDFSANPVDLVLDTIGATTFPNAVRALRPGGRLVSLGASSSPDVNLDLRDLFFRQISIRGTSMASAPEFEAMLQFVNHHKITPIVDEVLPLSESARALHLLEANHAVGKIAVDISGPSSTANRSSQDT